MRPGDSFPAPATRYIWDGNVIAAEIAAAADGTFDMQRAVWRHYEPQSFVPLLREEAGRILHVVTDHLGTPRELVEETGEVVWAANYRLWGGVRGLWTATDYNTARPHSALGYQTPAGFALQLATAIARPAPKGVNDHRAPVVAG